MEELKTLILDNAKNRFDRFGFQKTTMDEISRDCKISKRTLYEHFHDKQHLFDSLFVRECEKDLEIIFSRIGDVAANSGEMTPPCGVPLSVGNRC